VQLDPSSPPSRARRAPSAKALDGSLDLRECHRLAFEAVHGITLAVELRPTGSRSSEYRADGPWLSWGCTCIRARAPPATARHRRNPIVADDRGVLGRMRPRGCTGTNDEISPYPATSDSLPSDPRLRACRRSCRSAGYSSGAPILDVSVAERQGEKSFRYGIANGADYNASDTSRFDRFVHQRRPAKCREARGITRSARVDLVWRRVGRCHERVRLIPHQPRSLDLHQRVASPSPETQERIEANCAASATRPRSASAPIVVEPQNRAGFNDGVIPRIGVSTRHAAARPRARPPARSAGEGRRVIIVLVDFVDAPMAPPRSLPRPLLLNRHDPDRQRPEYYTSTHGF